MNWAVLLTRTFHSLLRFRQRQLFIFPMVVLLAACSPDSFTIASNANSSSDSLSNFEAALMSNSSGRVKMQWQSKSESATFEIDYKEGNNDWQLLVNPQSGVRQWFVSNILKDTTYQFRIRMLLNGVYSDWFLAPNSVISSSDVNDSSSNNVDSMNQVMPTAPSGFVAQAVQNKVTLTWLDNSQNEQGFKVYRRTNGDYELIATVNQNTYIDNSPSLTLENKYKVSAFNDAGENFSMLSVSASLMIVDSSDDNKVCIAPQWVSGTAYNNGDKVSNAGKVFSCKVAGWCSSTSDFFYEPLNGIAFNDAWQEETNCVDDSQPQETETEETKPITPTGLKATLTDKLVQLTWLDNSNNETGFNVFQKIGNQSFVKINTLPANAENHNVMLDAVGDYAFYISAENTKGESASNQVSVTIVNNDTDMNDNNSAQDSVYKKTYELNCIRCHNASDPTGPGDLTEISRSAKWQGQNFSKFLNKVESMQGSCAVGDDQCFEDSAIYIWNEIWGYALPQENLGEDRGVRGLRLLTPYELENSLEDIFSIDVDPTWLPSPRINPEFVYDNKSADGLLKYEDINQYLLMAEKLAKQINPSNLSITTIGQKLFRRPLTNAEANAYQPLKNESDEALLTALLVSPHFLYRSEMGSWSQEKDAYQLSAYEIATAMSYQLWGTTPSDNLINLAKTGGLSNQNQIKAQALQMMEDSRFADHFAWFVRYYTKTYAELPQKSNSDNGSVLTQALSETMLKEQQLAIKENLLNGSASINELFNPGYTFVNNALASHYEITKGISAKEYFDINVASSIIDNKCALCHKANGNAGQTNLVFIAGNNTNNFGVLENYSNESNLRNKPTAAVFHGGGNQLSDSGFANKWSTFINYLAGNQNSESFTQQFEKVDTNENRGGILHQGLFHISNSDASATSLVKRGKTIRENMMCHIMGVPSGVTPETINVNDHGSVSTKQRWDLITGPMASQGQCWQCHKLMNEPGSVLESFDWTGKFRTEEKAFNNSNVNKTIDTTGVLRDNSGEVVLLEYNNARELTKFMASDDFIRECMVDNLYRFSFGHEDDSLVENDVQELKDQFVGQGNFISLLSEMFVNESFLYRSNR